MAYSNRVRVNRVRVKITAVVIDLQHQKKQSRKIRIYISGTRTEISSLGLGSVAIKKGTVVTSNFDFL